MPPPRQTTQTDVAGRTDEMIINIRPLRTEEKEEEAAGQSLSTSATKDSRHELDLPQFQTVANLTDTHIQH